MKGKADVLAVLAELLANELTATNQYLLQSEMCANWGYPRLAEKLREESDGERGDATMLVERMLFLEGTPDLGRHHAIREARSVKEMLERDLELEYAQIALLERAIATCRDQGDNGTEDRLVKLLVSEQADAQWLEAQLELIRQVGEQNYLAQQLA